jgi:hypothetical protein
MTLPSGFSWRDDANVDVTMAGADIIAIGAAVLAHVEACYRVGWVAKDAVNQVRPSGATDADLDAALAVVRAVVAVWSV